MGNSSVRQDGRVSGGGEEVEMMYDERQQGRRNRANYSQLFSSMVVMEQQPSPRGEPMMFTPQVPLVPLQKFDGMSSPRSAWGHERAEYYDTSYGQGIPTMLTWSYGGKQVFVEGSWDNWKSKRQLQSSAKDFTLMKVLPSGVYQYRFIVDGERRCIQDMPCGQDHMGLLCNILDVQESVPEEVESLANFEPPRSPESSYGNMNLGPDDHAKEPPRLPPHLNPALSHVPCTIDGPTPTSRPQHVVLNHLYMQKGEAGESVISLGVTHRFRAKYVTVVLYKSMQR